MNPRSKRRIFGVRDCNLAEVEGKEKRKQADVKVMEGNPPVGGYLPSKFGMYDPSVMTDDR